MTTKVGSCWTDYSSKFGKNIGMYLIFLPMTMTEPLLEEGKED